MRPSTTPTTLRPDIQESFEEYPLLAQANGYVGLQLFPPIEVASGTGQYGVIPIEQLKRLTVDNDLMRAPGSGYSKIDWKFEMATYSTVEYGIEVPVDNREANLYRGYDDSETISAGLARLTLLDALEKRICALAVNTTDYTGAFTGAATTAWTTFASAVPVTDIFVAKKAVFDNSGLQANTLCMTWKDFFHLKMCAQFQDFMKYSSNSGPGNISNQDVAKALGFDELLVAGVSLNSAVDESTTPILSTAWATGKIWVGVKATNNSFKAPCAGRTIHWSGDGSIVDGVAEQYRDESRRADIMRVRHDVQPKILYKNCAYIITAASS